MRKVLHLTAILLTSLLANTTINANELVNPGFENGWQGWVKVDPKNKALKISKDTRKGIGAAQISSTDGYFVQAVKVSKNTNYELKAYARGAGILGAKVNKSLFVERTNKSKKWKEIVVTFNTGSDDEITIFAQINGGKKTIFDDFSLEAIGGKPLVNSEVIKLGERGLSPDLPPGKNFELIDWYLNVPADRDGDGWSDRIFEAELAAGYSHEKYFYTASDGGMVFVAPIGGSKTSANAKFARSELREMLRRGNVNIDTQSEGRVTTKNNWVLSTAPTFSQNSAGGVDGALTATLEINRVTTTGSKPHIGRVIIAQIGAQSDSPLRLFYRKLPEHKKGSFYIKHEVLGGEEEQIINVIGSPDYSAEEPANGIGLNERFNFEIVASGHAATVAIFKNGKKLGSAKAYLTRGGYDSRETYLYYQVGINNQNNSGDPEDYAQATYYALDNIHVGYDH